jgi:hypothetical protein
MGKPGAVFKKERDRNPGLFETQHEHVDLSPALVTL